MRPSGVTALDTVDLAAVGKLAQAVGATLGAVGPQARRLRARVRL